MATVQKSSSQTLTPLLNRSYTLVVPHGVILFEGILDTWSLTEGRLSVSVTNILSTWAQKTLAEHSPSCRWKVFKGDECRYSGAAPGCDRTYARCTTLGNTLHFGGFRWLPSIIDVDIWWGQTPTS
jgi:hypothetical protein